MIWSIAPAVIFTTLAFVGVLLQFWLVLETHADRRYNREHGRNGRTELLANHHVKRSWTILAIVLGDFIVGLFVSVRRAFVVAGVASPNDTVGQISSAVVTVWLVVNLGMLVLTSLWNYRLRHALDNYP